MFLKVQITSLKVKIIHLGGLPKIVQYLIFPKPTCVLVSENESGFDQIYIFLFIVCYWASKVPQNSLPWNSLHLTCLHLGSGGVSWIKWKFQTGCWGKCQEIKIWPVFFSHGVRLTLFSLLYNQVKIVLIKWFIKKYW